MTHITIQRSEMETMLEALWTTANPKAEEAITAIKAALAQPTSGDYALGYAEGFNDACKPKPAPVQEPVGYLFQHEETGLTTVVDVQQVEWGFEKSNPRHQKIGPVYLTPPAAQPAQRPWVGLTEAQFLEATRLAENGNY